MAVVDFAGMIVECLSTDGMPDYPDGWTLKYTDTGWQFFHRAGVWEPMGLGFSFASPTKSGSIVSDNNGLSSVTFVTPFVDNQYSVALTCTRGGSHPPIALLSSKTKNGFSIIVVSSRTGQPMQNVTVSWLATKDFNG